MGVHVAGTQHGHTYYLGPLEGTRAPALIALRSRAPAANIEFWPLQHVIWQIEGGLSYNDMSADSQGLIDRLIPEYKAQLRNNFVKTIQKTCGGVRGTIFGSLCNEINVLNARYQQAQQTLQRYGNNYDALAQQIVHVIPGVYQTPGPQSWSRLNSRVYARVTGGHIWQEMGTLEIRVLPGSGVTNPIASSREADSLHNVNYSLAGGPEPRVDNDTADVPIEAVIAYPDVGAGAQVLGVGPVGGGGGSPPAGVTCNAGFWLGVAYGGQQYQACIQGNKSAYDTLTSQYQGAGVVPLAAQAVYIYNSLASQVYASGRTNPISTNYPISGVTVYDQNWHPLAGQQAYAIIYSTLLWAWEYERLDVITGGLQPYYDAQAKLQAYAQADWLREIGVGATDLDTWLNPVYWLNQGVDSLVVLLGWGANNDAQKQLNEYMSLMSTLSRGYEYAANHLGTRQAQAIVATFQQNGICLQAGYTPSQFEVALANITAERVDWNGLATGLFQDALGYGLSVAQLPAVASGTGLAASCLAGLAGRVLSVQQVAGSVTSCLAENAAEDLASFETKNLAQSSLSAALTTFGANPSLASQAAGDVASRFALVLFVLNVADTVDENYNLPMATLVQQSINAANSTLGAIPAFTQVNSELYTGGFANATIAPLTMDTDGSINTTLALLYFLNYQYCAGTAPVVGCQGDTQTYQSDALSYESWAASLFNAKQSASCITLRVTGLTTPPCTPQGFPSCSRGGTNGAEGPRNATMWHEALRQASGRPAVSCWRPEFEIAQTPQELVRPK